MVGHCYAPGCKTNYSSARKENKLLGEKNPSTFKAPDDPELLKKWQRAIPRQDRVLTAKDRICELHFDEECIIRHYETNLPNGETFKMVRGRCSLKPNSVPTLFPNLPKYLSSNKSKRKEPTVRSSNPLEKRICLDDILVDTESSQESEFETMCQKLEDVKVPDLSWTIFLHQGYIMCASWKNLSTERRVMVFEDFSVKIFLRDVEVSRTDILVKTVENLSFLLLQVNNMIICDGVESNLVIDCHGYVKPSTIRVHNGRCGACRKYLSQKELQVEKNLSTKLKLQTALQKKKNALKRNTCLMKQVMELKTKIKNGEGNILLPMKVLPKRLC